LATLVGRYKPETADDWPYRTDKIALKTGVLLSHLEDRKHISYFHANFA
jgi:hypothetical protein